MCPPHHYALTVSSVRLTSNPSSDDARLLPRFRAGSSALLERQRLERRQAAVLLSVVEDEPEGKPLPLRHELTKPGDPRALRGIPAIGRAVGGAIAGTQPEREVTRREAA